MKTSNVVIICCLCLLGGIAMGYYAHDCGDGMLPPCTDSECCEEIRLNNPDCRFVSIPDTMPAFVEPVLDVNVLIEAYSLNRATNPGYVLGYSVDRDLLLYLYTSLIDDESIIGFRLYPGISTDNLEKTIYIPLISQGGQVRENGSSNFKGFHRNVMAGANGPCPRWCDNNLRVIR